MVRSARIERATDCLEGSCSIQLSYERNLCATRQRKASSLPGRSTIFRKNEAGKRFQSGSSNWLTVSAPMANEVAYPINKRVFP